MRTNSAALAILLVALFLWARPASSQIRVLDQNEIYALLDHLHEIDFQKLPSKGMGPGTYGGLALPTPLKLHDLTFTDFFGLELIFQPTSEPDSDSPLDGNFDLLLSPGAAILFGGVHRVVILDIRDNDRVLDTGGIHRPYNVVFTDKRGNQARLDSDSELVPSGATLIGVSAPDGIQKASIENVDVSGGPLAVTRLLFSGGH